MLELFDRNGAAPAGKVVTDSTGKPCFFEDRDCSRCGGQGGADVWKHTGWKCYRCGGARKDPAGPFKVKLYTAAQIEKMNATKAKRDAKRAEAYAAKAAKEAAEAAARADAFNAEHGELLNAAAKYAERSEFVADVTRRARELSRLTDGQRNALAAAIAKMAAADAAKAASRHVGTIGERLEASVTVERVNTFERPKFNAHWLSEVVAIVTMRDANGATIVVKSTSFRAERGARLIIKGTVKEHSEYKGEAQTVLQRVAIVKQLEGVAA